MPRRRWKILVLTAVSLLFVVGPICAQTPFHFGHQSWSTEDGLPQNSVRQTLQTSDGFLWIATEGGLARFDGISFKVFRREDVAAFPSDDIACLAETKDHALWIGTTDGLLRYEHGSFQRVVLPGDRGQQSVLSVAPAGDGSLLVLTAAGLTRLLDGHRAELPSQPGTVQALTEGRDGTVWLAAAAELLQYRDGKFSPEAHLPESPVQLQMDGRGTLWMRSVAGIVSLSPDGHPSPIRQPDPGAGAINTFLSDSLGRVWLGTAHGVLLLSDPSGKPVRVEGIGARSILSLTEDSEGNIWVGTESDGLHILRAQKFSVKPELSDHVITALAQTTDGSVWVGTRDDGLRVSRPTNAGTLGTAEKPQLSGALTSQFVLSLAAGLHNDLWVGTLDGLDHIQHGRVERFSSADGLPDDVIRSLLADEDGSLWIGTRRGLVHWGGTRNGRFTRIDGLPSDLIGAMLRTKGQPESGERDGSSLWVATLAGISQLHGEQVIRNETLPPSDEGSVITSIAEETAGRIWVGMQSGGRLALITANGLRPIDVHDGPRKINSLSRDALGNLWIGSARGVFRASLHELDLCEVRPVCVPITAHLGFADGMPTEETTGSGHPSVLRTASGDLWFATTRGVAILNPGELKENAVPPPTVIEHFLVDTVDELQGPAPYRIPFGRVSMTFDYVGLSFVAPSRIRYRYLLEGFDRQWNEAGARRSAYYTNLPPGHYVFRVQAANNDGVWNRYGASLAFSILPPFYRRLWFYALALAALAALAYSIYFFRVRRLRSEFDAVLAERNRIAREIHDTLAQNFVGISIHLQLAEQLLGAKDMAGIGNQLQETRALVQEGLNDARQSIWELRASVAQDSLPTRLSQAVERSSRVATTGHAAAGQVRIGGIYRPLQASIENEILRIAGEALANVNRHSGATTAEVALLYESDQLQLRVSDNGVGFDPDAVASTGGHFGLQGMRERTATIGATLSIVSSPGAGTTITLDLPLPRAERRSS